MADEVTQLTDREIIKVYLYQVEKYREAESEYYKSSRSAYTSTEEKRGKLKNMLQEQLRLDEMTAKLKKAI